MLGAAVALAACGGNSTPAATPTARSGVDSEPPSPAPVDSDPDAADIGSDDDGVADDEAIDDTVAATETSERSDEATGRASIRVDATGTSLTIDRRLFGTNVPAWLGHERFEDPDFQAATVESGTTLLRFPGGSWSNGYDWLGCEERDEATCFWTWAARPTDFIDFMQATDLDAMWTLSINHTAQSAAAAVAFFNGSIDDTTVIGTDRDGVDWGTVSRWARLRADNGNPDPIGIALWEVGNEVYGGRPDSAGAGCAEFGWEDVWTCNGAEYVLGDGEHDGYLAIREAMHAVDDDIEVGAVGVGDPDGWNGWGRSVIDSAGDFLDFYIVHEYGFDSSPRAIEAVYQPRQLWPGLMSTVRSSLEPSVPVAVTEYNLVAIETNDGQLTMTKAMNALFIADSIGQLALSGADIANQWNLANGTTSSGTDYGLINADDYSRFPQFDALQMWAATGTSLFPADVDRDDLQVYPTRHDDGRWSIMVINMGDELVSTTIGVAGLTDAMTARLDSRWTDDLDAPNLVPKTVDDLSYDGDSLSVDLPPFSISMIELLPNG
jgi:hypothetical protein